MEDLDVLEQLHLGCAAAFEALAELALECREEGLHDSVVVAVAHAAHAAGDATRALRIAW
jgi:hypothetical protein